MGGGGSLFAGSNNATGFAPIKAAIIDGTSNTVGALIFSVRRLVGDAAATESFRLPQEGGIRFKSTAALAAVPAGTFLIYMDSVDSKLKCKGPSGTVTILALP